MIRTIVVLAAAAAVAAGCGADPGTGPQRGTSPAHRTAPADPEPRRANPAPRGYEPPAVEPYRNGKRLAARVAEAITTYGRDSSPRSVAATVPGGARRDRLAVSIAPAVEPRARSTGRVLYVQLSGVDATSLAAMVVVRQHLERPDGSSRRATRVMDVRLRLSGAGWSLDEVGSVGGEPVPRPSRLSPAARRVLGSDAIRLPDSARWDIHAGRIDDALLRALADAAKRWPIAVTALRTGHPQNVWGTPRRSAHRSGRAADLYAIDRRLVIHQRRPGSPAWLLARSLVADGAAQVGSPWIFAPGGKRSFADAVHQDHVHLQPSPLG